MQRSELIGLIKARATPRELLDFLDQQSQDFILYTDDLKIFIEGRASGNFRITIYQAGKNSELYILSIQDFFNDKAAFVGWPWLMDKEGVRLAIQELFGTDKLLQTVNENTCLTNSTKTYYITIEAFNPSRIKAIYTPNSGLAKFYTYQLDEFYCFRRDEQKQMALKRIFGKQHAKRRLE